MVSAPSAEQRFQAYLPSPAFQGKELGDINMSLNEKQIFLLGNGCYGPICISNSRMEDSSGTTKQKTAKRCSVDQPGQRGPGRCVPWEPQQLDLEKHWMRVLSNSRSGPISVWEKQILLIPKNCLGRLLASSFWKYAQRKSTDLHVACVRALRKEARCWISAVHLRLTL